MRFITEKQFKSVNGAVQGELYQWWKESMGVGDLAYNNTYGGVLCITEEIEYTTRDIMIDNTTPLLSAGQLIEFIEWKTNCLIDIERTDGLTRITTWPNNGSKVRTEVETENLIEALWEVAQEVAAQY